MWDRSSSRLDSSTWHLASNSAALVACVASSALTPSSSASRAADLPSASSPRRLALSTLSSIDLASSSHLRSKSRTAVRLASSASLSLSAAALSLSSASLAALKRSSSLLLVLLCRSLFSAWSSSICFLMPWTTFSAAWAWVLILAAARLTSRCSATTRITAFADSLAALVAASLVLEVAVTLSSSSSLAAWSACSTSAAEAAWWSSLCLHSSASSSAILRLASLASRSAADFSSRLSAAAAFATARSASLLATR
mmetsp:Transcript_2486/g.8448  ORF Transcript_2486/g.8448 Transcript_2486/m.8448 type:complete len:255 (+) Transcript_2486:1654-2418(+)